MWSADCFDWTFHGENSWKMVAASRRSGSCKSTPMGSIWWSGRSRFSRWSCVVAGGRASGLIRHSAFFLFLSFFSCVLCFSFFCLIFFLVGSLPPPPPHPPPPPTPFVSFAFWNQSAVVSFPVRPKCGIGKLWPVNRLIIRVVCWRHVVVRDGPWLAAGYLCEKRRSFFFFPVANQLAISMKDDRLSSYWSDVMEHEMEEWRNDLEQHIRHCQCTCNHMGYGNYLSFKVKALTRVIFTNLN